MINKLPEIGKRYRNLRHGGIMRIRNIDSVYILYQYTDKIYSIAEYEDITLKNFWAEFEEFSESKESNCNCKSYGGLCSICNEEPANLQENKEVQIEKKMLADIERINGKDFADEVRKELLFSGSVSAENLDLKRSYGSVIDAAKEKLKEYLKKPAEGLSLEEAINYTQFLIVVV